MKNSPRGKTTLTPNSPLKKKMVVHEVSLSKSAYLCAKDATREDLMSRQEFQFALQHAGYNPTDAFLDRYWNTNTESLSYPEFQYILQTEPLPRKLDLVSYFKKMDLNGTGTIDKDLFFTAMTTRGIKLDPDVVKDLLDDPNFSNSKNKDMFDYEKFCHHVFETSSQLVKLSKERAINAEEDFAINSNTFKIKRKSPSPSKRKASQRFNFFFRMKGAFYFEGDTIISHQYKFLVKHQGHFNIKIEPSDCTENPVDVQFYLFREDWSPMAKVGNKNPDQKMRFVGRSELLLDKDFVSNECLDQSRGIWEGELIPGSYCIIPSTTGCKLKKRISQPKSSIPLVSGRGKDMKLTDRFSSILTKIFYQVDLDESGGLSRSEFNLFNWRTSGEEVQDEEWTVVKENFKMVNEELSLEGFLQLHQMEAEDNGGDSAELWITLNAMGYNAVLVQDEASIFEVSVSSEMEESLNLEVSGLKSGGSVLDKGTIKCIVDRSRKIGVVKGANDVNIFRDDTGTCTSFVVQNRSSKNVQLKMDFSSSKNVLINHPHLSFNTSISPKSTLFIAHLIPKEVQQEHKVVLKDYLLL